jgi:hypothetical protein
VVAVDLSAEAVALTLENARRFLGRPPTRQGSAQAAAHTGEGEVPVHIAGGLTQACVPLPASIGGDSFQAVHCAAEDLQWQPRGGGGLPGGSVDVLVSNPPYLPEEEYTPLPSPPDSGLEGKESAATAAGSEPYLRRCNAGLMYDPAADEGVSLPPPAPAPASAPSGARGLGLAPEVLRWEDRRALVGDAPLGLGVAFRILLAAAGFTDAGGATDTGGWRFDPMRVWFRPPAAAMSIPRPVVLLELHATHPAILAALLGPPTGPAESGSVLAAPSAAGPYVPHPEVYVDLSAGWVRDGVRTCEAAGFGRGLLGDAAGYRFKRAFCDLYGRPRFAMLSYHGPRV